VWLLPLAAKTRKKPLDRRRVPGGDCYGADGKTRFFSILFCARTGMGPSRSPLRGEKEVPTFGGFFCACAKKPEDGCEPTLGLRRKTTQRGLPIACFGAPDRRALQRGASATGSAEEGIRDAFAPQVQKHPMIPLDRRFRCFAIKSPAVRCTVSLENRSKPASIGRGDSGLRRFFSRKREKIGSWPRIDDQPPT